MKTYKILAIGNSFSQDATRYLYQVARSQGKAFKVINLYIGGCPLSHHNINILDDKKAYDLQLNGYSSEMNISIKDALTIEPNGDSWDFITIQQVSHKSINYDTYQPYLDKLSNYIKEYRPHAKQLIHETWSYEKDTDRLLNLGYENQKNMYDDIKAAYKKAYDAINADGIIPSGQAMQNLISGGIEKIHRDPFHLSLGLGRLTAAMVWYEYITGEKIESLNGFCDFDEPITEEEIKIAIKAAHDACEEYKKYKKF